MGKATLMIGVFKSNFINHQEIHSGKESFECDQWDLLFSKGHFLNHHRIHSGEKPLKYV